MKECNDILIYNHIHDTNYFSEDAMEFILSAVDSGVDERAVRKMIEMDEEQLRQICGEVGG